MGLFKSIFGATKKTSERQEAIGSFQPSTLVQKHLTRVMLASPSGRAADWARAAVAGLKEEHWAFICGSAVVKMKEALMDAERHSCGASMDDLFIGVSVFPCSVEEARQAYYGGGYFDYLNSTMSAVQRDFPHHHYMHFQFFWDGTEFACQFTLFPDKEALGFDPLYVLPTDLLTATERAKVGL